jgi:hypothetical protein
MTTNLTNNLFSILIILSSDSLARTTDTNTLHNSAQSGKIQLIIENYNKKKLNLLIKPQLSKDYKGEVFDINKAGWVTLKIPPSTNDAKFQEAEFSLPTNELGVFQYYSITGETNPLTPTGTCYNLEAGKCYKIVFIDNIFGTECISSEIKGPIPLVQGRYTVIPSRKSFPSPSDQNTVQPTRPSEVLTAREDIDY